MGKTNYTYEKNNNCKLINVKNMFDLTVQNMKEKIYKTVDKNCEMN